MERLAETLKIVRAAREKSSACVVAFSGGKDSLVVLDICMRVFERVEAYHMHLVPGLECVEAMLDVARKRWGVTIHQYPHFRLSEILRDGFCRPPSQKFADLPPLSVRDIQRLVQHDLGIDVVATGMRRSDSPHRRRTLKNTAMHTDVIHPIVGWKKLDVLAYMAMRHIPVPESTGGATSGVGLSPKSLLWLHDTFPNDFRKLCEVFPYAEAYVWRRTFHGVTA